MNILYEYIRKNLRLYRQRTLLTLMSIALATASLFTALSFLLSLNNNLNESVKRSTGNYHVTFNQIDSEFESYLDYNLFVDQQMKVQNYGFSYLYESQNIKKPFLKLQGLSSNAFDNFDIHLTEGRYPENSTEIIVSDALLYNGKVAVKVGDQIILNLGKRFDDNNQIIDDESPYSTNEHFAGEYTKTYEVVGIFGRSNFEFYEGPSYLALTSYDKDLTLPLDVYLYYGDIKSTYQTTQQLATLFESQFASYTYNQPLLASNNVFSKQLESYNEIIPIIMMFFVFSIGVIVLIYTSFSNSYTNREKHLAILKSNGATRKQIQSMIIYEEAIICFIAIPLGCILGYTFTTFSFYILNSLLKQLAYNAIPLQLASVLPILIITSIIILFVSMVSTKIAARRASRKSISAALDSNDEIEEITSYHLDTESKYSIETKLTSKHLRQNRKSYRKITVFFIAVIALFVFFQSLIGYLKETGTSESTDYHYDLSVAITHPNYPSLLFSSMKQIDNTSNLYITEELLTFTEDIEGLPEILVDDTQRASFILVSYQDDIVERFVSKHRILSLYSLPRLKDLQQPMGILLNEIYNSETHKNETLFDDEDNMQVELSLGEHSKYNFELVKSKDTLPGIARASTPIILISRTLMNKIQRTENIQGNRSFMVYYQSNNSDLVEKKLNMLPLSSLVSTYDVFNVTSRINEGRTIKILFEVLFYAYIAIVAMMGIMATMNIVSVNFEYRRKEFVLYRLLGLRMRSIRKMLFLEILYHMLRILLISIPIGLSMNALFYHLVFRSEGSTFYVPQGTILSCLVLGLILSFVLLLYTSEKIRKSKFAEDIKNEISLL